MGLLLLDLDGTLVHSSLVEVDEKQKLQPAPGLFTEPRLRPNVYQVIQRAALEGDRFAIVTNQGGVAWGYATVEEAFARIGRTIAMLDGFFGRPFSIHVCFAHPGARIERFKEGHERRKPSAAMLLEAIDTHLGIAESSIGAEILMVGDLEDDAKAAAAASIDFTPAGDFFEW